MCDRAYLACALEEPTLLEGLKKGNDSSVNSVTKIAKKY